MKSTPLVSAFGKLLNALRDLERQLPRLDHGDDSLLMRDILQTLAAASHLQTAVRSCKVKMRVDRARAEGRPIGGRPRGNNQADEGEIFRAVVEQGHSISSVAAGNGVARSTVRRIIARREGRSGLSPRRSARRSCSHFKSHLATKPACSTSCHCAWIHGPVELRRQELQESINPAAPSSRNLRSCERSSRQRIFRKPPENLPCRNQAYKRTWTLSRRKRASSWHKGPRAGSPRIPPSKAEGK